MNFVHCVTPVEISLCGAPYTLFHHNVGHVPTNTCWRICNTPLCKWGQDYQQTWFDYSLKLFPCVRDILCLFSNTLICKATSSTRRSDTLPTQCDYQRRKSIYLNRIRKFLVTTDTVKWKWIYRVSIKSFPAYKHLLQENYVEYKHIFTII